MTWPCTTALPYNYVPPTVAAGTYACFDWRNSIANIITSGPILHRFDVPGRAQVSITDLSTFPFIPVQQSICAAATTGRVYFATIDGTHFIVGFNPAINNYDKTFNSGGALGAPGYISSFTNVDEFCITAGLNAGAVGAQIAVMNMTGGANPFFIGSFNVAEIPNSAGPGNARIASAGTFAVASALDTLSVPNTIGFYTIDKTGAHSRIGQVHPTDLDGASTLFSAYFRVGYDKSRVPGILQCASTALGNYLFKVDLTGVLLWKLAIHNGMDLEDALVVGGKLFLIAPGSAPFEFYVIDTVAGTVLQHTVGVPIQNFGGKGASTDQYQMLIVEAGSSPGSFNWETFGPPPPPPIVQGGVIREGC